MHKKKPDPEMQQFQADLLQSIRDMKSSRATSKHHAALRDTANTAIPKAWVSEANDRPSVLAHGRAQVAQMQRILTK